MSRLSEGRVASPDGESVPIVGGAIKCLADYVSWTERVNKTSKLTLYRGQPVQGNLLPSIARKTPSYDSTALERTMLDQFRLMGASMLTTVEKNTMELMVVAQHYGLKTRLLDWTSNPLAALYFACSDTKVGDTYIYALAADDLIARDVYDKDPFLTSKTRVFQPPLNNPRVTAQHGWFTLHRYSDENKKFVALEQNHDTKGVLTELIIEASDRMPLLKALVRHGISSHTIYPDLNGLSQHINAVHDLA